MGVNGTLCSTMRWVSMGPSPFGKWGNSYRMAQSRGSYGQRWDEVGWGLDRRLRPGGSPLEVCSLDSSSIVHYNVHMCGPQMLVR